MDNPRVKRTTFVTLSALALAPWALPAAPADEQPTLRARVMAYVAKRQVELLREYVELLAIPNVASDGPGIRRNADHIVRMLEARGVKARLLDGEGGPPLVYGELRRRARRYLRGERLDHTLRPTALVHEVYLRLINVDGVD